MLFAGGMLIYFGLPDGGRIAQATLQRRQGCSTARVVVDRRVLQAEGAHALYIEGARAWPRRGDAGLGCLSVNSPSRLCHRAKPMQRTRALRKMTMLTIAASTAIQTNEGPQSRHTREPSKSEDDDYWIARTSLWSGRQRQTRMPGDDN